MEICKVVSVYFWYCFIYWADTSPLSCICIYIHLTLKDDLCLVLYRVVCIHVAGPYKYCLETTRDLGSRSQVFGHVQNSPPRPFSCFLLARSLPIDKNQRATVFHLILHFYSVWLWKHQKAFKDMVTSAAIIYWRTRFMKMLKDLPGAYFVNIAIPNH